MDLPMSLLSQYIGIMIPYSVNPFKKSIVEVDQKNCRDHQKYPLQYTSNVQNREVLKIFQDGLKRS